MIAAVVPAAGRSTRMGRPKLLMEFQGEPLIQRVVTALLAGGADRTVVVAPVDSPEGPAIAAAASAAGAELVIPESQPDEMRDSVELGLAVLDLDPRPIRILLTPGDVPGITPGLVARLLEVATANPDRIVIPTHDGHHGHPIVLPWDIAIQVRDLPDDAGVNRLVDANRHLLVEVPVSAPGEIDDLDTPEELDRWRRSQSAALDRAPGNATMTVRVRLFALARERAGRPEVEVGLATPATVGDLREALRAAIPQLGPICTGAMVSVDEEYASDQTPIAADSRLALIPPVSGGGSARRDDRNGPGNRHSR